MDLVTAMPGVSEWVMRKGVVQACPSNSFNFLAMNSSIRQIIFHRRSIKILNTLQSIILILQR